MYRMCLAAFVQCCVQDSFVLLHMVRLSILIASHSVTRPRDGLLSCFLFLVIMNSADVKVPVHLLVSM